MPLTRPCVLPAGSLIEGQGQEREAAVSDAVEIASLLMEAAFQLHDTHGLPLSMQLGILEEIRKTRSDVGISIPKFVANAHAAGWKAKKILTVVEDALIDVGRSREYIDAALRYLEPIANGAVDDKQRRDDWNRRQP